MCVCGRGVGVRICHFLLVLTINIGYSFSSYGILQWIQTSTGVFASPLLNLIIPGLGVDESEVVNEASFTNDLGADSLDTVELIMEFEKEFDIQIPDDQAENIATVGQAISYIENS